MCRPMLAMVKRTGSSSAARLQVTRPGLTLGQIRFLRMQWDLALEVWAMTQSRKTNEQQMKQAAQKKAMIFPTVGVDVEW